MNTRDIYTMILNELTATRECCGDICKYCKYNLRCGMISTTLLMVLGGEYHG